MAGAVVPSSSHLNCNNDDERRCLHLPLSILSESLFVLLERPFPTFECNPYFDHLFPLHGINSYLCALVEEISPAVNGHLARKYFDVYILAPFQHSGMVCLHLIIAFTSPRTH